MSKTIDLAAEPYAFALAPEQCALLIIDMQRDFLEPGGFGEMLGNDVSQLRRTIEPNRRLLAAWRAAGLPALHTREGHRPDLSDLPPAKKIRGRSKTTIGDAGPMGRILVRGEAGHDIIPELYPAPGEPVIDKPGKGAFHATDLHAILQHRDVKQLVVTGVTTEVCVNTTVREANDRGYDCLVLEDCVGSYFPGVPRHGTQDDQGAGRHLRLGVELRRRDQGLGGVEERRTRARRRTRRRGAMSTTTMATGRERYWVPGDWNAFFGFGTNILVNVLVLTGLLRFVLKMPDSLVFGRILPALGLMLFLSTVYYAWLAYRLAQKTGRTDVCALPSGTSVPHMFVVTFVVMLPILLRTNDPIQAWEAGLTWVFVQSFVLMAGGFIAPVIRRITPRAALLGSLAGISITFISMRPGLLVFETPLIGMVCFAIILANWFGGVRYFQDVPGGLIAIAAGTLIAWGSNIFGLGYGGLSVGSVGDAFSHFGFSFPVPAVGHVFSGFKFIGIILVTAIPFGIYDLVEAMDNVESAAAAGDSFPTTQVLTADGVISLIGCLLGNPFINAVYIGHPGWKAMGGRIGYSAATGVMVLVLTWLGIVALVSSLIPVVAILPILLYIGMLIGSQAFQETPRSHAPAIILAMIPQIAAWGKTMIDGALGAAGTNAATVGFDKLGNTGVLYKGLETLGGGATLAGIILGAVTVFIIERQLEKAAAFALAGSILTFFGLIHAEDLGIGQSPVVAVSYLGIAVMLYSFAKFAHVSPAERRGGA